MSNDKLAKALRESDWAVASELAAILKLPSDDGRVRRESIVTHVLRIRRAMNALHSATEHAHAAEAAQIGADPALSVGGCESVDRHKQMQAAEPFVYAYVYPDGTRFDTGGRELNGSRPTKAIPLYTHPQPAQDAKLPSDEDFRLHLGELTPAELRVAQAAFRYAMAKESGR